MQCSAVQRKWLAGGLAGWRARHAKHRMPAPRQWALGTGGRRGHNGRDGVKPTSDRGRLAGSTLHRPASALCQMTSCCSSREGRKREGGGGKGLRAGWQTDASLSINIIY